jgi:hypothetical protein
VTESTPYCPHCFAELRPGTVLVPTLVDGALDFPGDQHAATYHYGGSGELEACLKCPECGYSVIGRGKTHLFRQEKQYGCMFYAVANLLAREDLIPGDTVLRDISFERFAFRMRKKGINLRHFFYDPDYPCTRVTWKRIFPRAAVANLPLYVTYSYGGPYKHTVGVVLRPGKSVVILDSCRQEPLLFESQQDFLGSDYAKAHRICAVTDDRLDAHPQVYAHVV